MNASSPVKPARAPANPRGRVVERELTIEAPVEAVWRALTDARELIRWFPLDARVQPGPDGSIWMSWDDHYNGEGRIEAWVPNEHLRTMFPVGGPGPLATDYFLRGEGGGTVLRVVTSGFGEGAEWDEYFDGVRYGWKFELRGLQHYLEHHRGTDRYVASVRFSRPGDPASAWKALMGPDGWFGADLSALRAGDRFRTVTAAGTELEGTIDSVDTGVQLVAVIHNWNDALLRLELGGSGPGGQVWLWMSTYGVEPSRVRSVSTAWQKSLADGV